jgi:hydrogenase maturation protease
MSADGAEILVYGYGNPGRGDDGLGPALAAAVEAMALPGVAVDANYQLTVEDAAELGRYRAVIFVDAARQGRSPFFFTRLQDEGAGRLGWTSHSVTPLQVVALARDMFGSRPAAYVLGIRGQEFGELEQGLSGLAQANLAHAVAFARQALADRQLEHYAQQFGHPAAGPATVGPTGKA